MPRSLKKPSPLLILISIFCRSPQRRKVSESADCRSARATCCCLAHVKEESALLEAAPQTWSSFVNVARQRRTPRASAVRARRPGSDALSRIRRARVAVPPRMQIDARGRPMAHQFLNPAVAAAHMMQQAQGAGGGRFPVTGHPHPNPAQAGKYRTCVSGIAVGTRLRVTLPCNCQYNLTVPNPRAYLVFMPTGSNGGCVICQPSQHDTSARPPPSPELLAAAQDQQQPPPPQQPLPPPQQPLPPIKEEVLTEAEAERKRKQEEPRAARCGGRLLRPRRRRRRRGGRRRTAEKGQAERQWKGAGRRRLRRTGTEGGAAAARCAPCSSSTTSTALVSKRVAQHQTRALDALIAFLETAPPPG